MSSEGYLMHEDKPIVWLSGEIKTPPFSSRARIEAGTLLRRIQKGENVALPHSRPMPSIGRRCHELRIADENSIWRVIYRVDADAIVIGEVFKEKSRTTPKVVVDNCKRRFKQYDEATE